MELVENTREIDKHRVALEERDSSSVSIWDLPNNSLLFQIQDEMPISSGCHKETTDALGHGECQGYVPDVAM